MSTIHLSSGRPTGPPCWSRISVFLAWAATIPAFARLVVVRRAARRALRQIEEIDRAGLADMGLEREEFTSLLRRIAIVGPAGPTIPLF